MPAAGSRSGVAVVAMKHTPAEVAGWVEESAARQGVPVKVEDPGAVERVVGVVGGGPGAGQSRQTGESREGSKRLRPLTAGLTTRWSKTVAMMACRRGRSRPSQAFRRAWELPA